MFYYFSKIAFVFVLYVCVAKGSENSMINSVTLPKFGSSKINQNKVMENPSFKGDNAETDKNVNYKDWAKKNAAKIALGATALAGVVAAGILMRGRGSSKVNNLTEELQEDATQVLNNTLEKFRQEGNILNRGIAKTKDGKLYTGILTNTKKDGSNVTLTFENGVLTNSKIVKDGETIVDKNYELKIGSDKLRFEKFSINGKDTKLYNDYTWLPDGKYNTIGGKVGYSCIKPVGAADQMSQTPEYYYIHGKKLPFHPDYFEEINGNSKDLYAPPKTLNLTIKYRSNDLDNPHNRFTMVNCSNYVEGKKYPTCSMPKYFELVLSKFLDDFGVIEVDKGFFKSRKKDGNLFKYNYHTKEISDLNGISKEDAQEMADFWERHYAASKRNFSARSHVQQKLYIDHKNRMSRWES